MAAIPYNFRSAYHASNSNESNVVDPNNCMVKCRVR